MEGWIKLHRKLLDWEWYQDSATVHLFIHLLLKANHDENRWRGNIIKRGQVITGRNRLSEETGLSVRSVRTCLERLIKSENLTIKATNKFSIITICNYEDYQQKNESTDQLNDQQTTNKRPTNDQQPTTNKNNKNKKNDNNEKKDEETGKKIAGDDFITQIVDSFKKAYEEVRDTEYEITNKGKERSAAGRLLGIYKKKYPGAGAEETIDGLTEYFKQACQVNDPWLYNNMSLPILLSKFNQINQVLKGGAPNGKENTFEKNIRVLMEIKNMKENECVG